MKMTRKDVEESGIIFIVPYGSMQKAERHIGRSKGTIENMARS